MNAKQSLKLVSARLEEVEAVLARAKADIKAYNTVIDRMIAGESPCKWCEDHEECQLKAKDGNGCGSWWLKYSKEGEEIGGSESILSGDRSGGEKDDDTPCEITAF